MSKPVSTKGTPIEAKIQAQEAPLSDVAGVDFDDQLALDPRLKSEIIKKGLVFRWINGVKYKAAFGYDARQWQPYKRSETSVQLENNSFGYADSEGFIRRGDMILAVRSKALNDAEKQRNQNKINNLESNFKKKAVDGLKQSFKEAGLSESSSIIEGYDENN